MRTSFNAAYWKTRYATARTQWDIGEISAPLKAYADQLANKNAAILIPGCGNAYEAAYLLQLGFTNITLIDLVADITARVQARLAAYGSAVKIITGDFFELAGSYEVILEQTFLCALHPSQRQAYAKQMYRLLAPGGKLAGVLVQRDFGFDEPPFGAPTAQYQALFAPLFNIRILEPCYNSIAPRDGIELFVLLQKN